MLLKVNLKTISLLVLIFGLLYIAASLFLLNGKLTYWTSFTEDTIEDSRKRQLFVTENLDIKTTGDSLRNWNDKFEIWTNKRHEVKYFGIIFHWTFEDQDWRYLHLKPKKPYIRKTYHRNRLRINDNERDYMKSFSGGYESCCNWISCEVGDTIFIEFLEHKNNTVFGSMEVIVK